MTSQRPDSLDRVETLAKIGASLIGVQIEAVEIPLSAITADAFVFGYCFGLFDAMAQMAGLDQFTEGVALMGAGFGKIVDDPKAGAGLFHEALEMHDDADFQAGSESGADDLAAWAADANAMPAGIARRGRGAGAGIA
jgi:hypothetical protein